MSPVTPADFKAVISDPSSSLCGGFINTLLKLPVLVWKFFAWALDDSGNLTNDFVRSIHMPGDLILSAAPLAESPTRLLCDGRLVPKATYADLYAVIGDIYGTGTSLDFKLPDYTARFPVGVGAFPSGAMAQLAAPGGEEEHSLTEEEMPPHTHTMSFHYAPQTGAATQCLTNQAGGQTQSPSVSLVTDSTGGTGSPAEVTPHSIVPPFLATYIYVAA